MQVYFMVNQMLGMTHANLILWMRQCTCDRYWRNKRQKNLKINTT